MDLENKKIFEYEVLTNKIIFVDGVTRTGKAMLNNLLLGFENTSSIQFINILEQLMPMYLQKKMDRNAISSYLRLFFNENFYNYKLSRNLNFRYDDLTSIHNTSNPKVFFKNLAKKDGDIIVDELYQDDLYFQFQTHDLLTHYSSFLDLNIDVYVLELFRNPVDTVHSWYKRGWGNRFDKADPRSGTTLFKYNEYTIPHYVIGHEEEYIQLNEMEKCVFMHNLLVKKSIEEYKKLTKEEKKKILILKYENLLTSTENELNKMLNFLNLSRSSYMNSAMQDARVPRDIDTSKRIAKLGEIKANVSLCYYDDLVSLTKYYEDEFYQLEI